MALLKPYTFTAGTKARASEVNANFDALYTEVNSLESRIIDYESQIQYLQNTKADINGSYLNRFAVANPITNYDAVNKQYLQNATANSIAYINGLGITKVGDATISVDAGSCYDSTNTQLLVLENSLEKQNQTQAASSVYYVYLIGKATGNEDILISALSIDPNLPDEYLYYRRIGSYTTDSDNKITQINVEQLSQYGSSSVFFNTAADSIASAIAPDMSRKINISSGWVATSGGWIVCNGNSNASGGAPSAYIDGQEIYANIQVAGDGRAGYLRTASVAFISKGQTYTTSGRMVSSTFCPCKGVS